MTITRNFSVLANGAGSANNLSLGGATLGTNALAVTGTAAISGATTVGTLAIGGATLGTNALAVTGTTDISSTLNFGGFAAEGTVTAATTTNLGASTANRQSVTGNTTITGFGTTANSYRVLRFTGTPLLTYNATSLITPTGANIQAAPGDVATLSSDGSGNWRIISYQPYGVAQSSVVAGVSVNTGWTNMTAVTLTPGRWELSGVTTAGANNPTSYGAVNIGTTSGSATGTVVGQSNISFTVGAAISVGGGTIPPFDVTVTSNTVYYLNAVFGASSDTMTGSIRARRIY